MNCCLSSSAIFCVHGCVIQILVSAAFQYKQYIGFSPLFSSKLMSRFEAKRFFARNKKKRQRTLNFLSCLNQKKVNEDILKENQNYYFKKIINSFCWRNRVVIKIELYLFRWKMQNWKTEIELRLTFLSRITTNTQLFLVFPQRNIWYRNLNLQVLKCTKLKWQGIKWL